MIAVTRILTPFIFSVFWDYVFLTQAKIEDQFHTSKTTLTVGVDHSRMSCRLGCEMMGSNPKSM